MEDSVAVVVSWNTILPETVEFLVVGAKLPIKLKCVACYVNKDRLADGCFNEFVNNP